MNVATLCIVVGVLFATIGHADESMQASLTERVAALVEQTQKDMVFVEGGTFRMGNPGCWSVNSACLYTGHFELLHGDAPEPDWQRIAAYVWTEDFFDKETGYHHFKPRRLRPEERPRLGLMGSTEGDDTPVHTVTLSDFYIGAKEVTAGQMALFVEATGWDDWMNLSRVMSWETKEEVAKRNKKVFFYVATDTPNKRVGAPSWYFAQKYCQWLGKQLSESMSLPTEAQWEYAARNRGEWVLAATDTGWIEEGRNMGYAFEETLGHPPPPNPLGLYYMHGGKTEWTQDWFGKEYYARSPEHDPQGPVTGEEKTIRGFGGIFKTVYNRGGEDPRNIGVGFRCVLNPQDVKSHASYQAK